VYIEGVEFVDFRNYPILSLRPAPSLNVIGGPNAQGKTNLLEGLAVLLVGRSVRGARPAEMARWGAEHAVVRGELRRGDSTQTVRRVLAPREDGIWVLGGEGCAWARAIPFGWADLAIVNGGPQGRRNFIDGFAAKVYPSYVATYHRYRQVLSRRNHILQRGGDAVRLAGRLEPWNAQLVEVGLEIMVRRREAVGMLRREVARLYPVLGGRGLADLEYRSALGPAPTPASFGEALEARLRDESRRGQSLVGPHRDDVRIEVDGRDLRAFGSRGQQRLLALTLRLAEVGPVAEAVGSAPVLLLDDAMSELDPGVQRQVIDHLARAGQVFLTTAEDGLAEATDARRWEVRDAMVSEAGFALSMGAA
jgi:DNA replication and repair protein RecF